jgi:hypothetical protein
MAEVNELAKSDKLSEGDLYKLACAASLASAVVRKDTQLPQAEQTRLAEQYAVRAVELLRQACDAGYVKNAGGIAHLKKDPDLGALRARPDYQKLLAELEAEARPPAQ